MMESIVVYSPEGVVKQWSTTTTENIPNMVPDGYLWIKGEIPPGTGAYVDTTVNPHVLVNIGYPPTPFHRVCPETHEWKDFRDYREKRAVEYPPLSEFADAFYWFQEGDPTLMDAYLQKCRDVKANHPK